MFSWYIREKKQGKLLSQFRSNKKHQQALAKFLVDHPSISWLHSVFCGNYEKAADVLLNLGFQEMESVKRKKVRNFFLNLQNYFAYVICKFLDIYSRIGIGFSVC